MTTLRSLRWPASSRTWDVGHRQGEHATDPQTGANSLTLSTIKPLRVTVARAGRT